MKMIKVYLVYVKHEGKKHGFYFETKKNINWFLKEMRMNNLDYIFTTDRVLLNEKTGRINKGSDKLKLRARKTTRLAVQEKVLGAARTNRSAAAGNRKTFRARKVVAKNAT
jgi:hypothetical protein